MTCTRYVFRACAVLDGKDTFSDHLACVGACANHTCKHGRPMTREEYRRTNDMNTQNLICLLLRQDLDKAIRVEVGLCPRVGRKHKLANVVFDTISFELLFGLADPGDLGVGVDDGRYGSVVDVTVAVLDVLNGSDTW